MKRLKIAFFAEMLLENYDGAIRTMYHILQRIPKDKFEIVIYCGVPPENDIGFEIVTVPTITIPFNRNYKLALHQLSQKKLANHLDNFRPDLIHISTPSPMGHYAIQYAQGKKIPVTTIYHTHYLGYIDYYLQELQFLIKPVKNAIVKTYNKFYNNCNKVFVPTYAMVEALCNHGVDKTRMEIWPRGIDRKIFNPHKSRLNMIQSLTGNSRPNILFASRLVWEKNLKTLIEVYKLAEAQKLKWNFIIAGDGVAKNQLMHVMPNAYFLGELNQEDLASYYASCDVFLFPSDSETYGNVVIEALSCGTACVIANGGGSKSFIEHGENGFLCTQNQAEEYLSYIQKILENPILKKKFEVKGLEFVSGMDWDIIVENLLQEWRQIKGNLLLID